MIFSWKKLVTILLILSVPKVRSLDYPEKNEINQSGNDESVENTVNFRLPTEIVPIEYFIHLTPYVAPSNFSFDGTVKIIGKVKNSTSKIVLHVDQIHVAGVNVFKKKEDGSTEILKITEVAIRKKYQFLIIRLMNPITDETTVNIEIFYSGKINTDMYGLFRNWYKTEDGSIRWMFATEFQPSGARRVFPCFDEPSFKAEFHVSIDVPENFTALGNMPIESFKGGVVKFEKTPPMSTYTLAVAFGDLAGVSTRIENVSYSVWSSRPVSGQLSFALSVAPAVVDYLESHLNVSYGLNKLALLASTDFPSEAMENWGLIVLSEILTLYDPALTPLSFQKSVRNLIAHEIAHQWFGNLVTTRWWDCTWLNEAFAAYFEYHAHDHAFDSWNLESDFVVDYLQVGLEYDSYNESHPVTNDVYSESEIESMFDPISYNKGASLVRMLEKLLGSKIFFRALGRYLEKNKFSTSNPEDLYESFEQEIKSNEYKLNMSISKLMDSWTLQTGYPVLDVKFNEGSVTLKQSRFFLRSEEHWSDETLWLIPLSWTSQSESNFNVTNKITWLTEKSTTLHLNNTETDWFIFNIQQTGFYRVNYDKKMWKRITETLKSKEFEIIHEVNRASLINDLFNLGWSGLLDYDIVLTASQYLTQEINYFPWKAASSGLTSLKKRFAGHYEIMNYFKNYLASLVSKNYDRLGFYEKESDSDLDKLLRELTLKWLCHIEHEECVKRSLDIFERVQANKSYTMSPNHQAIVYCTAIKLGSPEYWNILAEKYEKSNHATERLMILYGFSCSRNSSQLESLLQKMIPYENGIRKQDAKILISYIAENSAVGVQTLLNFTEANAATIIDYFSNDNIISEICGIIIDVISTDELVLKFKEFVKDNGKKYSIDESYIEVAENGLKWYTTNTPKILQWWKANYPTNIFKSFSDI